MNEGDDEGTYSTPLEWPNSLDEIHLLHDCAGATERVVLTLAPESGSSSGRHVFVSGDAALEGPDVLALIVGGTAPRERTFLAKYCVR